MPDLLPCLDKNLRVYLGEHVMNDGNAAHVTDCAAGAAVMTKPPKDLPGRGIVIPGGGEKYLPSVWVNVNMLRHVGCTLPIQVWHLGPEEMPDAFRQKLEPLGVECVDARKLRDERLPHKRLNGYEVKAYSMLHCPWAQVLLMDADNVAVRDPSFLFDEPAFKEHGAIFWPDRGRFKPDNPIWKLTGIEYRDEPEFESGQMLIDKTKCWQALLLANWFNEQSEYWYSKMHGDKDTFRFAWHQIQKQQQYRRTKMPDYVMVGERVHSDANGYFQQLGMDGQLLFQHGKKWKMTDVQAPVGYQFSGECIGFMRKLSGSIKITLGCLDYSRRETTDRAHLATLHRLVKERKPQSILELGAGAGVSGAAIGMAAESSTEQVIVDDGKEFPPDHYQALWQACGVTKTLVVGDSWGFLQSRERQADFIFHDAMHGQGAVREYRRCWELTRPGGVLAIHDVDHIDLPSLVRQFAPEAWRVLSDDKQRELGIFWKGNGSVTPMPRRCVATLWTPEIEDYGRIRFRNAQNYCFEKGYAFEFADESLCRERHPSWSKIPFLLDLLNRYDEVFWTDADSLFMELVDLPFGLAPDADLILSKDFNGMNFGHFVIRNTQASRHLMETAWGKTDRLNHPNWEQQAVIDLLQEGFPVVIKWVEQSTMNAYPGSYKNGNPIVHFAGHGNRLNAMREWEKRSKVPRS